MKDSKNFTLFADQRNVLSLLTDEQAGKLLRALYAYNDGEDPDITDQTVKIVFVTIKSRIDSVWQKSETLRKNRLGKTKQNKQEQTKTNDNKTEQNETNDNGNNKILQRKEKERTKERVKEILNPPLSPNGDISPTGETAAKKETLEHVLAEQPTELIPALVEFINHRKQIKKPLSAHALRLNIATLKRLAPDDIERQKYLAEYAIMKGWQGFYLPDEEKQADTVPKPTTYAQQIKYEQDQQARALLAASQRRREANATQLSGNGGTSGTSQSSLPPWWGPN